MKPVHLEPEMSLLRKTDLKKHMAPAIKRRVPPSTPLAADIALNGSVTELPVKEPVQTLEAHRSEDLAAVKSKSDRS